jgi:exodeoxyribonuclease-3
MRIITWNINSINARFQILKTLIEKHQPDVLMLQEIKCQKQNFPEMELNLLGYTSTFKGQKSYNGVAILTKEQPSNILTELPNANDKENARFISLEINGVTYVCIYAPNGNPVPSEKFDYKLKWHKALNEYLDKLNKQDKKVIIGGDFNIVPTVNDVYDFEKYKNNALCQPESIAFYDELTQKIGYTEVFRNLHKTQKDIYTFHSYMMNRFARNHGFRIDFFMTTSNITNDINSCEIDFEIRKNHEKPSDHSPLILNLKF